MFTSTPQTSHLIPLQQAKEKLKSRLLPRITVFEERLKKSWLKRGLEYFQTGYGEAGYKRTKDFLAEMDANTITSTQDLIRLMAMKKYHSGYKMRMLLLSAVLEICRFNMTHVELVEYEITNELLDKRERYRSLVLANIRVVAANAIYEKIIAAEDFGKSYLEELDNRLVVNQMKPKL